MVGAYRRSHPNDRIIKIGGWALTQGPWALARVEAISRNGRDYQNSWSAKCISANCFGMTNPRIFCPSKIWHYTVVVIYKSCHFWQLLCLPFLATFVIYKGCQNCQLSVQNQSCHIWQLLYRILKPLTEMPAPLYSC